MDEYEWYSRLAKNTVLGSRMMAEVLWTVICGEEQKIPDILAGYPGFRFDGLQAVVEEAKRCRGSADGRIELLGVYMEHRYNGNFCVDDSALRSSYTAWKTGQGSMKLPRLDDSSNDPGAKTRAYAELAKA